jgi:UDP-2,3-diacylglucosamine hydrolase
MDNKINYIKQGILVNTKDNKTIYVTHGDEIEIDNRSYMIYKNIVNNRFLKLLSDEILSFKFIEDLAQRVSKESRDRNEQRYESPDMQEKIKDKFRASAEVFTKKLYVDYLVCGHSHVKDQYRCSTGALYLNNGYAPYTQSYLLIDENGARFIDL